MDLSTLLPITDNVVSIRPLAYADAEAYAEGSRDPMVRQFGHLPLGEYTPQVVREQIDTVLTDGLQQGKLAVMAIADAENDRFLGSAVLFDITSGTAEIGYWLEPTARGRGFARRTVELLSRMAYDVGATQLVARTEMENGASRRVLQAAGFELREERVREETPSGEVIEAAVYVRRSGDPAGPGSETGSRQQHE